MSNCRPSRPQLGLVQLHFRILSTLYVSPLNFILLDVIHYITLSGFVGERNPDCTIQLAILSTCVSSLDLFSILPVVINKT